MGQDYSLIIIVRFLMQEYNIIVKTMMPELSDILVKSVMQKSAEYKMDRIVAVEVEPDKLVRTRLVSYNLMQNMLKEDRLCYKRG